MTIYDRRTHALLRDVDQASRSSLETALVSNDDGSVDIYFAPDPDPRHASNFLRTPTGAPFELIFRFYGAQPSVFTRDWKLPDVHRVDT